MGRIIFSIRMAVVAALLVGAVVGVHDWVKQTRTTADAELQAAEVEEVPVVEAAAYSVPDAAS